MYEAHFFTFRRVSAIGTVYGKPNSMAMLTDIYISALLVNEEPAEQIWQAWDAGETDDETAYIAWMLIAFR